MARRRARRRSSFRKPASPVPADLRGGSGDAASPGTACARPSGAARSATAGARQASLSVRTAHCRSAARSLPGSVRVTNAAPPPTTRSRAATATRLPRPFRGEGGAGAALRAGAGAARSRPRCGSIRALGERARSFIVAGRSSGSGASIRAILLAQARRHGGQIRHLPARLYRRHWAVAHVERRPGRGRREHQSQAVDVGAAVDPAVIEAELPQARRTGSDRRNPLRRSSRPRPRSAWRCRNRGSSPSRSPRPAG